MSVTLSVYSQRAFKEFVLPPNVNMETALMIRRDVFGLREDIEITLENLDGQWYFNKGCCKNLFVQSQPYAGQPLTDGAYFRYLNNGVMALAFMVRITEDRFTGFEKYQLLRKTIEIGTKEGCALQYSFEYNNSQFVTHCHATIEQRSGSLFLTDKSRNGTFVNDVRVEGERELRFGDRIDIWGLNIVALGTVLAVRPDAHLHLDPQQLAPGDVPFQAPVSTPRKKEKYHRSPRSVGHLITDKIAIEAPPGPQQDTEPPLFLTIGPALTMALPMVAGSAMAVVGAGTGGFYMYSGIITAVMSAAIGAVWAIVNVNYSRKLRKKGENQRFSAYSSYLVRITEDIRQKYEYNARVLATAYPPAAQCLAEGRREQHLWERNSNHADFLTYRLGLGDQPFQVDIQVPPEKFEIIEDSLREKPRMIKKNYQTLHQVPVCVDLAREHMVGLVGGPDLAGARALLQNLVAQIAVQNCYTEVKLAFLYREDQGDDTQKWEYCRWLPHVWSADHKVRYVAANKEEASDVLFELASVLRARSEQQANRKAEDGFLLPWYIVVLESSSLLENEPIARYLLDPRQKLGVTTIFLADQPDDLPNACECIIRNDAAYKGMYHARETADEAGRIQLESVNTGELEALARFLGNVQVNEAQSGGEIPSSITFFDMYGVVHPRELHAEEQWKRNRPQENMRALLGCKSGGQPCYLDLHEKYHGPHGLVAGTTGSGKSETLQTYILSLAAAFSPYDVGLFIIDYKGGGMANLFNGLPHMLGSISNLSGAQVHRAMVSIKSENMRRQRIFNENGVNNINLYTTLFKNGEASEPVPHLFIIIDEFAELKREQPDFMRELISVAQVGRSLGVHLILATQKPSGTVDDNIWSNSRFKLCLRVQDRQDSMDMLHRPDAAYLTQAGRGFLQVGNDEIFEQFQSGWSGAAYDAESAGNKQVLARMVTGSGKTALVGSYIKRQQNERARERWIRLLTASCLHSLDGAAPNEIGMDTVCARMYKDLAAQGAAYPESDHNTRLLENLIGLVSEGRGQVPVGELAGWVAEQAARRRTKLPERKEKTQLDAMVEYLAGVAREQGYKPLAPLWMAPLPEKLYLAETDGWAQSTFADGGWPRQERRWELAAVIGRADDPANQSQLPVEINFTQGGHLAVVGASASGKSTFVQTLLYALIHRYSPQYLNIYALDFSSRMTAPFEGDPHVGGILYENDAGRAGKLFYLLNQILTERKQLFRGGNYEQYVMVHGVTCPAVVVVVDNMANFREKTGEAFDDEMIRMVRESAACGIYWVVTGAGIGMTDIPGRLAENLRTTIALELSDVYQYADVLRCPQPSVLPESGIHGRGLADLDGTILEFQTALAAEADDDYGRADLIQKECARLGAAWEGRCARRIPYIPENPVWKDLAQREDFQALAAQPRYLPFAYDAETAGIYSIDVARTFCFTVSGRARTGKTNVLKLLMRSACAKGAHIAVLEPDGGSLRAEAAQLGARHLSGLEEIVAFVGELGNTFVARNKVKWELINQGLEPDAVFERMGREPLWLVLIADLVAFARFTDTPEARELNLSDALQGLIERGELHNIVFAAGLDQERRYEAGGLAVYEEFVRKKTGIHLGGNVANQQLFDFNGMPYSEQSIVEKPGTGLVAPMDGEPYLRVVLPLAKG